MKTGIHFVKWKLKRSGIFRCLILFSVLYMLITIVMQNEYQAELFSKKLIKGNLLEFVIFNFENAYIVYLFLPVIILLFCLRFLCFENSEFYYQMRCVHRKYLLFGNFFLIIICGGTFVLAFLGVACWCGFMYGLPVISEGNVIHMPYGSVKGILLIVVSLIAYWTAFSLWFYSFYLICCNRYLAVLLACIPLFWGFAVYKNLWGHLYIYTFFYQIVQGQSNINFCQRLVFWGAQILLLGLFCSRRIRKIDLQERRRNGISR